MGKASGVFANFLRPESYAQSSKTLQSLMLALNPAATTRSRTGSAQMSALDELIELAESTPGPVQYWDPLKLSEKEFWGQSNDATIGFLRHAEIKHGRVAVAGFVGYCIHENGIRWPWPLSTSLPDYSSFEGLSAPAVWDAIPYASKIQILVVIGFFEFRSESRYVLEKEGQAHYMRGGKPGYFPTFKEIPHPVPLNLFDPLDLRKNFQKNRRPESSTSN